MWPPSCGPEQGMPRMRMFVVLAGCSFLLPGFPSCDVTLTPLFLRFLQQSIL